MLGKPAVTDTLFRVYRIIGRTLIKYSRNPRPTSDPFVTGDGFRALGDHRYDNLSTHIDPAAVKEGQIVFVGDSRIEEFVEKIHPAINHPYILITHNGDATVSKELFEKVASKIVRWYGINVTWDDPKIVPLPLGVENQHYYICGIPAVFRWVMNRPVPKKNKIFYAFTVATNPAERGPALAVIKSHQEGETLTRWHNFFSYLQVLNEYKMVLSPPGSSTEGHRTWDTLYLGGVPIVKSCITTRYFKRIGLPLHVVDDWNELLSLDAASIAETFITIQNNCDKTPLTMEYWRTKIKDAAP